MFWGEQLGSLSTRLRLPRPSLFRLGAKLAIGLGPVQLAQPGGRACKWGWWTHPACCAQLSAGEGAGQCPSPRAGAACSSRVDRVMPDALSFELRSLTGCDPGYYGDGCKKKCSCPPEASCDRVTGECWKECPPGYHGESCHQGKAGALQGSSKPAVNSRLLLTRTNFFTKHREETCRTPPVLSQTPEPTAVDLMSEKLKRLQSCRSQVCLCKTLPSL